MKNTLREIKKIVVSICHMKYEIPLLCLQTTFYQDVWEYFAPHDI